MIGATVRLTNSGCTSWSDNPSPSPIDSSRSSFSIREWRLIASRSADPLQWLSNPYDKLERPHGRFIQNRKIFGHRREGALDLLPATGLLRLPRLPDFGYSGRGAHADSRDSGAVHLRAAARVRPLPGGPAPRPRDQKHNAPAHRGSLQSGIPSREAFRRGQDNPRRSPGERGARPDLLRRGSSVGSRTWHANRPVHRDRVGGAVLLLSGLPQCSSGTLQPDPRLSFGRGTRVAGPARNPPGSTQGNRDRFKGGAALCCRLLPHRVARWQLPARPD